MRARGRGHARPDRLGREHVGGRHGEDAVRGLVRTRGLPRGHQARHRDARLSKRRPWPRRSDLGRGVGVRAARARGGCRRRSATPRAARRVLHEWRGGRASRGLGRVPRRRLPASAARARARHRPRRRDATCARRRPPAQRMAARARREHRARRAGGADEGGRSRAEGARRAARRAMARGAVRRRVRARVARACRARGRCAAAGDAGLVACGKARRQRVRAWKPRALPRDGRAGGRARRGEAREGRSPCVHARGTRGFGLARGRGVRGHLAQGLRQARARFA